MTYDPFSPSTVTISLQNVTINDIKLLLYKQWRYTDISIILPNDDMRMEFRDLTDRMTQAIRTVTIMNEGDPDRDRLWMHVRLWLEDMISNDWQFSAGSDGGILCIHLLHYNAEESSEAVISVPAVKSHLAVIDDWLNSFPYMN